MPVRNSTRLQDLYGQEILQGGVATQEELDDRFSEQDKTLFTLLKNGVLHIGQNTIQVQNGSIYINDNIYIPGLDVSVVNDLIFGSNSKMYIRSGDTNVFGWRDLKSEFVVRATTGSGNPTFGTLTGLGGMQGLIFSSSSMNQVWANYHIDHDYAMGTPIYPHIHWMPLTTALGTVRWGIEYTVAKGHQQSQGSKFQNTTTVFVTQSITQNSQNVHFVAEVSDADAIPADLIEPDTVIKIRFFRDAANDTYSGNVHAWQGDLHYMVGQNATVNKAPNFFGGS
jgi:hypothetical protein